MNAISEHHRLQSLYDLAILDTPPEVEFDELAELAAAVCGAPISAITLIDARRMWVKAGIGLETRELPREIAFCDHLVRNNAPLLVVDAAADIRFRDNPLVTEQPGVRFYAGVPVRSSAGHAIGGLCVLDRKPKQLSAEQVRALEILARQVSARLELRLQRGATEAAISELRRYQVELEEANALLRRLSFCDALTGLANRRAFEGQLAENVSQARRKRTSVALLMIDVDRFKRINDQFGHSYGDEVLQRVAAAIARSTRLLDLAVRYGGEEFAVLMPATSTSAAVSVAERIQRELLQESWGVNRVTVSIGIAVLQETMADGAALVGAADLALYEAKAAGRDRLMVATHCTTPSCLHSAPTVLSTLELFH